MPFPYTEWNTDMLWTSEVVATILFRSAGVEGERRRGREEIIAVGVNCSNPNYVEVSRT